MPDFVIKGGTVIDGTGAPGHIADVAIKGDKIEAIEPVIGAKDCLAIDAEGKIVCPGIVDSHSHADISVWREDNKELLSPLVQQGITTFIGGNCGFSMAPVGVKHPGHVREYIEMVTGLDFGAGFNWTGTAGFIERIEKNGPALNTALLAPHGVIRIDAMGLDTRHANEDEIKHMARMLEQSLEEGAIGLSTGLAYIPGLHSDTLEIVELGKIVKKYGGIFASHLRSYTSTLPLAIDEVIEVCRENDIRGQVSHIFWMPDMGLLGRPFRMMARGLIKLSKFWTPPVPLDMEVAHQLKKLDRLREEGVNIGMDVMPTTTAFTPMWAFFPPWVFTGTMEDGMARIADSEKRKEMLYDITHGKPIWPHTGKNTWSLNLFKIMGWECVRIMSVVSEKNKRLEGMQLMAIARERGQHPFDAACDLLLEEDGRVFVFESLGEPEDNFTERSMYAALKHPQVSVCTDAILMGFGYPSYLFYGCYPRFISRYVRENKMLSMEEGVRKMTGLAAEHFGLKTRGLLKKDWFADVLVFDPETIAPNCSFTEPIGKPVGIEHVFINGHHAYDNGTLHLDPAPGRVLRRE